MSHEQEILDLVGEWHTKRFRESEISLNEAVSSLDTDDPLIEALPGVSNSRWILYHKNTKKVAVLVHAGIWQWKCDLETGNYVPEGYDAPDGLPENRIQDTPSFKCEFSYGFDTTVDASIWENMQALEDHVTAQPGFNKGNRQRKNWQSGRIAANRRKYVVSCKVFAKKTPYNSKESGEFNVPYDLHPWIIHAMDNQADSLQIPNPERPRYYDFSDGVLRKLEDTNNPTFQRNDIIWMACKIGFVVSGDGWSTEIIPIEFIRVGKIPEQLVTKSDTAMYPAHEDVLLEPGAPIEVLDGPAVRQNKRKADEIPDRVLSPSKRQTTDLDFDMAEVVEGNPREIGSRNGNASGSKTRSKVNKENKPAMR